jgi:hypothetical protein
MNFETEVTEFGYGPEPGERGCGNLGEPGGSVAQRWSELPAIRRFWEDGSEVADRAWRFQPGDGSYFGGTTREHSEFVAAGLAFTNEFIGEPDD